MAGYPNWLLVLRLYMERLASEEVEPGWVLKDARVLFRRKAGGDLSGT